MQLYIRSFGAFECSKENSTEVLTRTVKQKFKPTPRRIDNFIKLGLLGVQSCLQGNNVEQCGIYLTAFKSAPDAMNTVLESIYVQNETPMPLSFIHSLSNSAIFYISKIFQLDGTGVFLAAQNQSLNQLYLLAANDLINQRNKNALIGIIDESSDSYKSIWFLVSGDAKDGLYQVDLTGLPLTAQQHSYDSYLKNFEQLYSFCNTTSSDQFISDSPGLVQLTVERCTTKGE